MNEPNTNGADGWNPPDEGLTLDELFPNPELPPQGAAPNAPVQTPQTPAEEYFLKAETGTVYKTHEDAVRGTAEKDRTIKRLQAELAQRQAQQPAPATQTPAAEDFRKQMFKRLAEAASKGDEIAYMDALAEFQTAVLSQFAPALSGVYEEQAISKLESEAKDFRQWLHGEAFNETMVKFPLLAGAIKAAKADPRQASQLEEFYRLAYRAYAAEHVNDQLAQAARSGTPTQTQVRPTISAGTPTPQAPAVPLNNGTFSREQVLTNRTARQEFLKRFREERPGAMNAQFGDLGL